MTDAMAKTNEAEASISRDHIEFLERNDIVMVERLTHEGKTLRYKISLSDTGIVELEKLRERQII